MKRRPHIIAALLTCSLLLPPPGVGASVPAPAEFRLPLRAKVPVVEAANVFESMYFAERADSDITPAALAALANRIVARRGLDFWFDACPLVRANRRPRPMPKVSGAAMAYGYTLRRVGGRAVRLDFISDHFGEEGPGSQCGECLFQVPALRVTRSEMLIVAGGRRYRLKRPAGFVLREASLVEGPRRAVRRTWHLPYDTVPLGLSADRAKLYVPLPDFDDVGWDDKLAVELSDAGVRLITREGLALPERVRAGDAPESEGASFVRYGEGAAGYVLRLNDPCALTD